MAGQNNDKITYSAADIEKYWKGDLSPAAMNAMEMAALEDPLLADAMDGYHLMELEGKNSLAADLTDLDHRLQKRIKNATPKTIPINWWKPAVAALLIISAGIAGYFYMNQDRQPGVANSEKTTIPPAIIPPVIADTASAGDSTVVLPADVAVLDKVKKQHPVQAPPSLADKRSDKAIPVEAAPSPQNIIPKQEAESNAPIVAAKEPLLYDYKGVILNEHQQPVEGAIINLKGRIAGVSVVTDTSGRFNVPVSDSTVQLTVSLTGYQSDKYQLSALDSTNNIAINLKPSNASLNEVVITGYSTKKKAVENDEEVTTKDLSVKVQDAVPLPGWNDYNTYLRQKQVVPDSLKTIKGNVVLSFVVTANGKMSSFIVEQSLQTDLDREAIRLVKTGPAWKILNGRKARVIVIVPF